MRKTLMQTLVNVLFRQIAFRIKTVLPRLSWRCTQSANVGKRAIPIVNSEMLSADFMFVMSPVQVLMTS